MYSVRIATTLDRDYPSVDFGQGLNWDRLTEILRREVSADAAILLAEPVADHTRGQTDWHVTADQDPRPISALAPEEREKLLADLDRHRQEVLAYAEQLAAQGGEANQRLAGALRSIILVPDTETHVWSVDGKPVLVAWGRQRGTALPPDATIVARSKAPPEPVADPTILGRGFPGRTAGLAGVAAIDRLRDAWWLIPLLWALLALIVASILYLLIAACAVDLPILRSIFYRCEATAGSDPDGLRTRNLALAEAVRNAERDVAYRQGECAPPRASEGTLPLSPDKRTEHDTGLLPGADTAELPDAEETDRRVEEAGGTHGLLDITLAWNGREDLDLHVYCPGGRLNHSAREVCGGKFEIDRNSAVRPLEDGPIEHVTWVTEPPAGKYEVVVFFYGTNGMPKRAVPFRVEVRDASGQKDFTGSAEKPGSVTTVTEFTR